MGGLGLSLSLGELIGCGRREQREPAGSIEKNLALYIWSDYLADQTVPDFEREFGVQVTIDNYESNEEMAAKLQTGATGYDLVVPSSYLFPGFLATNLLAPIERKSLPIWGNVAPQFLDPPWDPGNAHSVPWQWGTTGIAYRKDLVPARPTSWSVFFDSKYGGKMTMLDDPRDVIGSFLKLRGHSLNSTDPTQLSAAKADAITAKRQLKAYLSAPVKAQLIAGDVWIAQLWSGDAAQAIGENPNIEYLVPDEGASIYVDALVIPRSARHPRAAHEFMNYTLRPAVGAAIADKTGYGTPNQAALPLTRAKTPYPTPDLLARLEYQTDLGAAAESWDRIWTEIKSS
jgi:spermidine/putrescine-binding protein